MASLPPALSPREFNALSPAERLALVRQARGRRRYDLLIEAADVHSLVARMPTQELYQLARELGPDDCAELVGMLTPEQFTTFIDLEAWPDDLFDDKAALRWLALLWESGPERVWTVVRRLDFDFLVLLLSRRVRVEGGLADLLEESGLQQGETDRIFRLAYADEESAKLLGPLLELALQHDQEFYLGLLEAVRQEGGAELEEDSLRLRDGRLSGQGFPARGEALQLYTWFDPDGELPARAGDLRPHSGLPPEAGLVASVQPGTLLAAVLAAGVPDELGWDLTWLVNKVLVALRLDVGKPEDLRAAVDEVAARLELALAYRCGNDPAAARELFLGSWPESLFRLGFSLTLRLQQRARKVRRSAAGRHLDPPYREVVEALSRPRPLCPGEDGIPRLFRSLDDLTRTRERLAVSEAQLRLFEEGLPFTVAMLETLDLSGCNPAAPEEATLAELLLTALANRLLGQEFLPRPLAAAQLLPLRQRICREGVLDPVLREETLGWLESAAPGAGAFGRYALSLWEEGLCRMAPDALDPRAVAGLIVRTR